MASQLISMSRKLIWVLWFLFMGIIMHAQSIPEYFSLDKNDPIHFFGNFIVYGGDTIVLSEEAFFIDGNLSEAYCDQFPFVFSDMQSAMAQIQDGSEEEPMQLFIAPYVYWIDNPDDPEIRVPKKGGIPYGMEIDCEWLSFIGLTKNPENVVLACNRGQTIGAKGNFTMFHISGDGTYAENVTFGNYCNVDLNFPLKPELNRSKRASAIVQAQLIICDGDKIVARNSRFISRLNLCNFVGAKRILFDNCHLECTDDALCGSAVYLNCSFGWYSSKPFYHTTGTGAVFLNCDIESFTGGKQYFTKAGGQVAVVDSRFSSKVCDYIGWQNTPANTTRNYQYQVSLNHKSFIIENAKKDLTVNMYYKELLNAYRFNWHDTVVYNTYNLLQGNDDWDPMGIKEIVQQAEKEEKTPLTQIPVKLVINASQHSIETGRDTAILKTETFRFGNFLYPQKQMNWSVAGEGQKYVRLQVTANGQCKVIPINKTDSMHLVIIKANTPLGLEAAIELTVAPAILKAPRLKGRTKITKQQNGSLQLQYVINTSYTDVSEIVWYRCKNKKGSDPIEVAVSRLQKPLTQYRLKSEDVGYYLMAKITPCHIRSYKGETVSIVYPQRITKAMVKDDARVLETSFKNLSLSNQEQVIPGFWICKHIDPVTGPTKTIADKNKDAWTYGTGYNGGEGHWGAIPTVRSAAMLYTALDANYTDMELHLQVAPYKTAGQGFSMAHLYMDILIKFDTKTMSGYGLRLIRTTKYHNAVDAYFVRYEHGKVSQISEPVSTTCYRPVFNLQMVSKGNKLIVNANSDPEYQPKEKNGATVTKLQMEVEVEGNSFGGFGIMYNGGEKAVFKDIKVRWD